MAEKDRTGARSPSGRPAVVPPPSSMLSEPRPSDALRDFGQPSGSGSHADDATRVSDSTLHPDDRQPVHYERPSIEGYDLREEIHRGGQGIVFRAVQLGTKRVVALKVLLEGPFASETARRRFEREVELAASLRHPCIVTILDSGISRGRTYFAMEYIEGQRLDQYLKSRQPSLRETLQVFEKICDAVNFAHLRGVIHRDLKPSNILIDAEGLPHVLDFGLAKLERTSDPHETTVAVLSTTGQVVGTLAYMSPEQAAGTDLVDVRSDVYSLGVVFYEALLERSPYNVTGPLGDILHRIAHDDPARPRSVRSTSRFGRMIDDELETILLKTLEKDPARRYQTAGDLGRDVHHYLCGEPIEAKRASGLYMLKKTIRRYRVQAAAIGLILAMLVGFLIVFAFLYRSESQLRTRADELQALANKKATAAAEAADAAERAQAREAESRREAQRNERLALVAAEDLRRAIVRQKIQAGDLAQLRGDLSGARDEFWDAYAESPDSPAALWKLRDYYLSSGDLGTIDLFQRSYGPSRLSPSARLAAVCDSPRGISVRSSDDGRAVAWLAVPGQVRTLDVTDEGSLAATGDGWAWRWDPGKAAPTVMVALLAGEATVDCHGVSGGGLVVVTRNDVRRWRADGQPQGRIELSGICVGSSAISGDGRWLAVATQAGIECVDLAADTLATRMLWPAPPGEVPSQVRFTAATAFAALTTHSVICGDVQSADSAPSVYATIQESWRRFSLDRDADLLALSSDDGRVAILSCGELRESWRVSLNSLDALSIAPGAKEIQTLDGTGLLTRWSADRRGAQHDSLLRTAALTWAVSDDMTTQAFLDEAGAVHVRGKDGGATAPLALPPAAMSLLAKRPRDCSLAISADGSTLAILVDERIWIPRLTAKSGAVASLRWSSAAAPSLREVALSPSGQWLALRGRSEGTGRELIRVLPAKGGRRSARDDSHGQIFEFAGSPIRFMRFVPESGDLLVSRANGELHLLRVTQASPGDEAAASAPAEAVVVRTQDAWDVFESPAYRVTMDHTGLRIAAACDDGIVRVVSMLDTGELARIPIGREVTALSLNRESDTLLVRTADGTVTVFDIMAQESVAQWKPPGEPVAPLAAWVGAGDELMVNQSTGVMRSRPQDADARIRENAALPRQQRMARRMADGDFAGAWTVAAELHDIREPQARAGQEAIVEAYLRRTRGEPPGEWIVAAGDGADWPALLRLGTAAAEGGRYAVARDLLSRAQAVAGELDALSTRTLAECDYLLDAPDKAIEPLARILKTGGLDELEMTRTHIEYIAALVSAGRRDQARESLRELESLRKTIWRQLGAGLSSAAIAGILVEGEGKVAGGVKAIASLLPEQSRAYQDDLEFFAGEADRRRGDLVAARARYQSCVDQARDAWPANWARFRLEQLAETAPP